MQGISHNYPIAAILRDISLRIITAKTDICRRIVSQKLPIFATDKMDIALWHNRKSNRCLH